MRVFFASIALSAVLSTGMCLGLDSSEKSRLTQPEILVPLVYGTSLYPVLGTLVGKELFFSSEAAKAPCVGESLFSIGLDEGLQKVTKVGDAACVEDLQTDGKHLYATLFVQNRRAVYRWKGDSWSPAFEGDARWNAAFNWRRHELEDETKVPWFSGVPELRFFSVGVASPLSLLIGLPTHKETLLFQYSDEAQKTGRSQAIVLKSDAPTSARAGFGFDKEGRLYFPIETPTTKIQVISTRDPALSRIVGGETPYSEPQVWDTLPAEGDGAWHMRSASVVSAEHGILVHGKTDYQNEWSVLAYYSASEPAFHRVRLPQEIVEGTVGVSLAQNGILLSNPARHQIIWAGEASPFSKNRFPPRDLNLRVIEEENEK